MSIFENIKINRLLHKRNKLLAELRALENDDFPGGNSSEHYIQLRNVREQIQSINKQISELLNKG